MVQLDVPSRVQLLEALHGLVGLVAEAAGFDEDSLQDIQVAVHESLVNAIVHGNQRDDARRVTLRLELRADGLEICVRDEGWGFDPTGLPDPLAPENLSKSSGRGILLMGALMDEVSFHRSPSGGMEVKLLKRRTRDAPRPARTGEHGPSETGA